MPPRTPQPLPQPDAGSTNRPCVHRVASRCGVRLPAHLPRERVVHPRPDRMPLLWRRACQAGRDHHRDPGESSRASGR